MQSADQIRSSADLRLQQIIADSVRRGRTTPCTAASCDDPLCGTHRTDALRQLGETVANFRPLHPGTAGESLASLIDHTLLKPEATPSDVERLCNEALEHRFASVCVNLSYVPLCKSIVANSPVRVCTVVGFPLGATSSAVKAFEAGQAIADGAAEIDMVIAIGLLRSGRYASVQKDIECVVRVGRAARAITKVIIETALLTEEEKIRATLLVRDSGADFIKTSTGFSSGGAVAADVALLRRIVGPSVGVKAAGGIRTREDALRMIAAGATRIGTSASVSIVTAGQDRSKDY